MEAVRILETLYGNPGRIPDDSAGHQTKGLPSRRKTITSSLMILERVTCKLKYLIYYY